MTKHGEPMAWLEAFLLRSALHPTNRCELAWPYARSGGRGPGTRPQIWHDGKRMYVAAYILTVLVGPCPPGKEVCHATIENGCGNGACINPLHIRWGTHEENLRDLVSDGTTPRGERSGQTHLTEDDVWKIRDLLAQGALSQQKIADKFGVTNMTISNIKLGRTWGWLEQRASEGEMSFSHLPMRTP